MQTLIKKALTLQFPQLDEAQIENLLSVVEATPNDVVATEILLGVFEMPEIPSPKDRTDQFEYNVKFLRYDPFTQKVHYSYQQCETDTLWVPRENPIREEALSIDADVYYNTRKAAEKLGVDADEFSEKFTTKRFPRRMKDGSIVLRQTRESHTPLDRW